MHIYFVFRYYKKAVNDLFQGGYYRIYLLIFNFNRIVLLNLKFCPLTCFFILCKFHIFQ